MLDSKSTQKCDLLPTKIKEKRQLDRVHTII